MEKKIMKYLKVSTKIVQFAKLIIEIVRVIVGMWF